MQLRADMNMQIEFGNLFSLSLLFFLFHTHDFCVFSHVCGLEGESDTIGAMEERAYTTVMRVGVYKYIFYNDHFTCSQ